MTPKRRLKKYLETLKVETQQSKITEMQQFEERSM